MKDSLRQAKTATNVMNNPGRTIRNGAKIGSADVSNYPEASLSTIPGVKKFTLLLKDYTLEISYRSGCKYILEDL